ncbi:hypothetical protein HanRHA438_Chr07g0307291 [Helianthus annuus]|nr:hypothetical protein HanRHA438_Chr07g0307291 [Helianthus annuus]
MKMICAIYEEFCLNGATVLSESTGMCSIRTIYVRKNEKNLSDSWWCSRCVETCGEQNLCGSANSSEQVVVMIR